MFPLPWPPTRSDPNGRRASLTCDSCQAGGDGGCGARCATDIRAAIEQLEVLEGVREPPVERGCEGAGPALGRGRGCPPQHSPLSLGSGTAGLRHGHAAQCLLQEVLTEELGHLCQRVH